MFKFLRRLFGRQGTREDEKQDSGEFENRGVTVGGNIEGSSIVTGDRNVVPGKPTDENKFVIQGQKPGREVIVGGDIKGSNVVTGDNNVVTLDFDGSELPDDERVGPQDSETNEPTN
jgi:hypothetical protein